MEDDVVLLSTGLGSRDLGVVLVKGLYETGGWRDSFLSRDGLKRGSSLLLE